ncbi:MAG: hypothetical protein ACFFCS_08785 [Candidatus Hodarchaeota archaeon]
MVRPLKYLINKEYENKSLEELPNLPLTAIRGIGENDMGGFGMAEIDTIPELSEVKYANLEEKHLSDFKLNRGIAYAIDIMIHVNEPGVHYEILPIDELLDRPDEATKPTKLASLKTVAIEGIAKRNHKKLKKAGVARTIKELADASIEDIKSAGLLDWEAEKYSQFAKWIMEYAEDIITTPKMDNLELNETENILKIKFDNTKEFGLSKTGKTIIVATSRGGRRLHGTGLNFTFTAYKYPDSKASENYKPKRKQKEAQNIDVSVEGDMTMMTIDTSKDFGVSASGKSIIIASSRGNKRIEGTNIYYGLNIYRILKRKKFKQCLNKYLNMLWTHASWMSLGFK